MFVCAIPLWEPEGTPAIITFADVLCIPWFGWLIVIVVEPEVVEIGFWTKVLTGNSSLTR